MPQPSTITIDGPAASGKSTLGARLAQELGYLYFDTGVMYRAVTWAALERQVNPADIDRVSTLAETIIIDVKPDGPGDGRQYTVLVDDRDATWDLRRPDVEKYVSLVSSYPRVRAALTAQQRRIAAGGRIVMVGRDIGTVVLPDADLKIFLRASAEERARRRLRDSQAQGQQVSFEEILAAIRERDRQDEQKPISPLVPAPDAVIIDTGHQSIEEVLARLKTLAFQQDELFTSASLPNLRNPQRSSLLSLGVMIGLLFVPALVLLGMVSRADNQVILLIPTIIVAGLLALLVIAWLVAWGQGRRQLGQIKAFLISQRPLLRWRYTPEEWHEIREATWQEQHGDWRVQLGCMTFLFSLVGLLVGGAVGADEGLPEAITYGLTGGLGGLLLGALLGGVIAAGNYLAAWSAYRQTEPGIVALAPHEIYANAQYFRGNGSSTYLKRARLLPAEPGIPPRLLVELKVPPKPRAPRDEEWEIVVPSRLVETVKTIMPQLNPPRR